MTVNGKKFNRETILLDNDESNHAAFMKRHPHTDVDVDNHA